MMIKDASSCRGLDHKSTTMLPARNAPRPRRNRARPVIDRTFGVNGCRAHVCKGSSAVGRFFALQDVPGDGHCGHHSLGVGLFGSHPEAPNRLSEEVGHLAQRTTSLAGTDNVLCSDERVRA